MKKQYLHFFIGVSLILIILTGCTPKNSQEKTIEDKVSEEISYVEDSIFTIVNKYAKGEYLKGDNTLDWDSIFKDEEKINQILDTIILDLGDLKIDNNDLVNFSDELNRLIIATANNSEDEVIVRLSNLYAMLPKYMAKYSNENNKIMKKELKSFILASYSLANAENWTDARTVIQTAVDKYNTMMNNVDYMQENSYNLNSIYILIEELKNAINLENIELVNYKYIAVIEKIR